MEKAELSALRRAAILPIKVYQRWISPWLPMACRFHPTCSQYMMEAIQKWGLVRGIWLGVRRLARCHPWSRGGFDPVP